jgi:hypothetical protein
MLGREHRSPGSAARDLLAGAIAVARFDEIVVFGGAKDLWSGAVPTFYSNTACSLAGP